MTVYFAVWVWRDYRAEEDGTQAAVWGEHIERDPFDSSAQQEDGGELRLVEHAAAPGEQLLEVEAEERGGGTAG